MPGRKKLSPEARAHRAEAGRRNLEGYLQRLAENDAGMQTLSRDIEGFAAQIRAEIGPNASATTKALAEEAILLYQSVLLVAAQLAKRRQRHILDIVERVSRLTGRLTKVLSLLKLDVKVKPRTLADVLPPRPAPKAPVLAPKEADVAPPESESPAS